jgi:hypothetical protein
VSAKAFAAAFGLKAAAGGGPTSRQLSLLGNSLCDAFRQRSQQPPTSSTARTGKPRSHHVEQDVRRILGLGYANVQPSRAFFTPAQLRQAMGELFPGGGVERKQVNRPWPP